MIEPLLRERDQRDADAAQVRMPGRIAASRFQDVVGDPAAIGIADIHRPDYGDAVQIVFVEPGSEQVNACRVNGVMVDPGRDIPIRLLGKAQQIVQLNFHQRMQSETIEVLDVILINLMYLGHMTQEEFIKAPEGMKLQERVKPEGVFANEPVADLETAVAQAGVDPTEH